MAATDPSQASPRSRNRRGEGRLLRGVILDAAVRLLDDAGSEEAVTLRAVAREAGIAAPSIYAHFADRQAILLAMARDAFSDLAQQLRTATADAGSDPVARLRACCAAYLEYAATRPQRYRVMFGGLWNATHAVSTEAITETEAAELGQDVMGVLVEAMTECVDAGRSSSSDPRADAVALWVGLHGLAHQRVVSREFPWPADIAERLIDALAHLDPVGSSRSAGRPRARRRT